MTFWDRIIKAIHKGAHGSAYDINRIEIHYEGETLPPYIIEGGDESYDFLAAYSSFDEVQAKLSLPERIEHISCVNMLDEFNMQHYDLEHPDTDKGTIEEFYRDGLSMLEQEAVPFLSFQPHGDHGYAVTLGRYQAIYQEIVKSGGNPQIDPGSLRIFHNREELITYFRDTISFSQESMQNIHDALVNSTYGAVISDEDCKRLLEKGLYAPPP